MMTTLPVPHFDIGQRIFDFIYSVTHQILASLAINCSGALLLATLYGPKKSVLLTRRVISGISLAIIEVSE